MIFYSRFTEALGRSGEEVWCVIYISERSFWLVRENKLVGGIRIEREGQRGDIDRNQASDEGAFSVCMCVLLYYIDSNFLSHFFLWCS